MAQVSQTALRELIQNVADGKVPQASEEERARDAIIAVLDQLGGLTVAEENIIFEGEKLVAPAQFRGDIPGLIRFLQNFAKSQEATYDIEKTFNYRPWDGAAAFERVLRRVWGTTGVGVAKDLGIFGTQRPQYINVEAGLNKSIQVPWGTVEYAPLETTFELQATKNREKGVLFHITGTAPRKHRARIEAIFQLVEKELKENSIYRGQAITAAEQPGFVDLWAVDPEKVVYSESTLDQLDANVWSVLKYTAKYKELGLPLKRAVLFEGPNGTGKTLGGMLTAQHAVRNGWTFILVRPEDDVLSALKTAQLYAPAVVQVEDIERIAGTDQTAIFMSRVLDALDSAQNKSAEVVTVFTTNHADQIARGALRPGRLDAVITIDSLDAAAFEKLIRQTIKPEMLADDVDFDRVSGAMERFRPSFVVEAATRTLRYALARGRGVPQPVGTRELVLAAESLRPQLELHENATATSEVPTTDEALRNLFGGQLYDALDSDYLDGEFVERMERNAKAGSR